MRKLLIAAFLVAPAFFAVQSPVSAAGYNEKWCAVLRQDEDSVRWECQYATFEACRPHVLAGDRGFCNLNPSYVEPGRVPAKRRARQG